VSTKDTYIHRSRIFMHYRIRTALYRTQKGTFVCKIQNKHGPPKCGVSPILQDASAILNFFQDCV